MGESIYRFARREIFGAMRRAWTIESQRLAAQGRSAWSVHNEILQSHAVALVLQGGLIAAFGAVMLPFLAIHNPVAWWQLTSTNYVEHYGLLRARLANGEYEAPKPHHSWNANHVYTNLVLFQLERHSDHHANAARRYQALRHYPDLPQLPSGYQGMFPLAYVPWLWFRVMVPRHGSAAARAAPGRRRPVARQCRRDATQRAVSQVRPSGNAHSLTITCRGTV